MNRGTENIDQIDHYHENAVVTKNIASSWRTVIEVIEKIRVVIENKFNPIYPVELSRFAEKIEFVGNTNIT